MCKNLKSSLFTNSDGESVIHIEKQQKQPLPYVYIGSQRGGKIG
jgi:hypothetical protein